MTDKHDRPIGGPPKIIKTEVITCVSLLLTHCLECISLMTHILNLLCFNLVLIMCPELSHTYRIAGMFGSDNVWQN